MAEQEPLDLLRAMRNFRSRLTQAETRENWWAVIAIVQEVAIFFHQYRLVLPDTWARFAHARNDAVAALRREGTSTVRVQPATRASTDDFSRSFEISRLLPATPCARAAAQSRAGRRRPRQAGRPERWLVQLRTSHKSAKDSPGSAT